jgi:hypothetical protein
MAVAELSQIAVADKDSDSCLKLRLSNHQILKTISQPTTNDQLPTLTFSNN